ncbi:MAG: hypothetical protein HYV34_03480 [Candidatus Kerfeldbacteria bacterium]|nr:hypothetical protein [Candidatus Kerfeldbacteria bacterium]
MSNLFVLLALVDGPLSLPEIKARLSIELDRDNPFICGQPSCTCKANIAVAIEVLLRGKLLENDAAGNLALTSRGRHHLFENRAITFVANQSGVLQQQG